MKPQIRKFVTNIVELKKAPGAGAVGGDLFIGSNEPVKECGALMTRQEDLELIALCHERKNDPTIKVSIENL
ncbi:plasmid stabilization protein [Pseudomonas sp. ANT_J12]|nr:plasmid stabilization protein [Pseudomonas sp. ANT_J12]